MNIDSANKTAIAVTTTVIQVENVNVGHGIEGR